jgi:hypothetical protein
MGGSQGAENQRGGNSKMIPLKVTANIDGLAETAEAVQRLRHAVADRRQIHARLALFGKEKLRVDIAGIQSHRTANRLGASPTEHLAKQARKIEAQSDATEAVILLPRAGRLRAAYGTYTIKPGAGKKFLAIPANAKTYGKRPGEIQETLKFVPFGGAAGRFKALVFPDGEIAYWLKASITMEEDKTLIPFDILARDLAEEAVDYIDEIVNGKGGAA